MTIHECLHELNYVLMLDYKFTVPKYDIIAKDL
jgi:hypothetical protein